MATESQIPVERQALRSLIASGSAAVCGLRHVRSSPTTPARNNHRCGPPPRRDGALALAQSASHRIC